ncbi:MAG TPA: amino acid dehydrogenase [Gemmatimonadales bacterium]|nr:amino acid dehydrogenase [Gemmatimonadales bacterium]
MRAPAKSSGSSSPAVSILLPSPGLPGGQPATHRPVELFDLLAEHEHEQVSVYYEPSAGYRGIIAIHSTVLGPALGGTRFWDYQSDAAALVDALRLARGMTYKAAVAGLNLGGGKSVILGHNRTTRREALFRAHGRHIESLKGRYITAEDVGTTTGDMEYIKAETNHVVGLIGKSGDPSPVTGYGVYRGIKACARYRFGTDTLHAKHVALQGCGSVGYHLARLLHAEGARLTCTDVDPERVRRVVAEFGAEAVGPDAIYDVAADIFAPCALGAVLNDATIPRLHVEIVAGGANNQLAEDRHGDLLEARQITYAPDYVINGGGLINVNAELHGWAPERARSKAGEIYDTLLRVFEIAREEGIPSYRAADRLAEQRIAAIAKVRRNFV